MNSSSSATAACITYTGSSSNTYSISNVTFTANKLASGSSYISSIFYYAYG